MPRFEERQETGRGIFGLIAAGVAVVFFLIVVFSTYYTIDQGERGVVLHYGAVDGTSDPGLHFKFPLVTSIEKISVRPFKKVFGQTTQVIASSADQQVATIQFSINAHTSDVIAVYNGYTSPDNAFDVIVAPKALEQLKNVFGKYNAVEAIQHREKLNADVSAAIIKVVQGPIVIDSIQIENIGFSQKYLHAVEERMEAIVRQQQAESEKQRRIINADAAAYEVKAQADAKAHQIEVQGEAEAKAIRARGDALKDNPGLPQLVTAERWNGVLPSTMPPNATVPFIQMNRQ